MRWVIISIGLQELDRASVCRRLQDSITISMACVASASLDSGPPEGTRVQREAPSVPPHTTGEVGVGTSPHFVRHRCPGG